MCVCVGGGGGGDEELVVNVLKLWESVGKPEIMRGVSLPVCHT